MSVISSRIFPSLLLALLALPAHSANKTPIVTNNSSLAFGRFVPASGGTITVTPAGARNKTGAVVLVSGGAVSSALFTLSEGGNGKALVWSTITLPSTATLSSGGATMTLNNFVSDPPGTMVGTTRTDVKVGATLTVAPNQAQGNYSGSFSVTVNYQ
jgi:hypothetical protein